MSTIRYAARIALIIALDQATACTSWVKLTEEGEKVHTVEASDVANCRRLGRTESSVKDKVARVSRNKDKVAEELENLARNSAARMGGDTIVAEGPVQDGIQSFIVYDCPR